jgi:CHAD domain-containing protein
VLAAALALGVGVAAALAKSELKRRRRKRKRGSRLKRLTLEQIDLAIALLEGRRAVPAQQTIHETRKALKRARALVRLQRGALGEGCFARNNAVLREAGRRLASARDAEVVVEALDALVKRHPKRLARSAGVARLRARLVAERERAQAQARHGAEVRGVVLTELYGAREDLKRWQPAQGDAKTAREGLKAIYGAGRKRGRLARKVQRSAGRKTKSSARRKAKSATGRNRRRRARMARSSAALHDWRKRAKDLRYAAEALELRGVAKRADRLGEVIGEEHDLWLLEECVQRERRCFKGDKASRKELQRQIARRRGRLRKRAFKLGRALYGEPPKRFVRRQLAGS